METATSDFEDRQKDSTSIIHIGSTAPPSSVAHDSGNNKIKPFDWEKAVREFTDAQRGTGNDRVKKTSKQKMKDRAKGNAAKQSRKNNRNK